MSPRAKLCCQSKERWKQCRVFGRPGNLKEWSWSPLTKKKSTWRREIQLLKFDKDWPRLDPVLAGPWKPSLRARIPNQVCATVAVRRKCRSVRIHATPVGPAVSLTRSTCRDAANAEELLKGSLAPQRGMGGSLCWWARSRWALPARPTMLSPLPPAKKWMAGRSFLEDGSGPITLTVRSCSCLRLAISLGAIRAV